MGVESEPYIIRLPRAHQGQYGCGVVDDDVLDLVRVGQPVGGKFRVEAPVIINLFEGPRAALHHVGQLIGPRSSHVAPVLNVPELLDHLASDHHHVWSGEDGLQGDETGLFQLQYQRKIVGSGNRLDRDLAFIRQADIRARLAAAQPPEPLKAVLDIVRGQEPTVHWCLIMPFDSLADLEHERHWIRALPALGQPPYYGLIRK